MVDIVHGLGIERSLEDFAAVSVPEPVAADRDPYSEHYGRGQGTVILIASVRHLALWDCNPLHVGLSVLTIIFFLPCGPYLSQTISFSELWALLHFIMPTLFDSHDEFNEWFSKDIESHAENKSAIDENQLSRLHMILKPFMLRRIKKDVENELSDKIEILMYCQLKSRQKMLYQALKNKISIEDLLQSSMGTTQQAQNTTSSLMNLVMQFRKVCNHPELFERQETKSPFHMSLKPYNIPKLIYRDGQINHFNHCRGYESFYHHSPQPTFTSLYSIEK
eukprot:g48143.t1